MTLDVFLFCCILNNLKNYVKYGKIEIVSLTQLYEGVIFMRIHDVKEGKWSFGHDNENYRGKLVTRKGDRYPVEAYLKYDQKTNAISWGREENWGVHPDWLDTIEKMKAVLTGNRIKLRKINLLTAGRYTYHVEGEARFLIYRDMFGKEYALGTANNDWLVTDISATRPADVETIPLPVLARMLLPLEEFLKKEYGISE